VVGNQRGVNREVVTLDSTTFKVFGIIIIIVLVLFLCDPARGEDVKPVDTWNAVHELLHGDYGIDNVERNRLVNEYAAVLALVGYTEDRINNFDSENGLDNLDIRINALLELIDSTSSAYESVIRDITWFVKNHKGI
jgi:hypothetical protein